MEQKELPSFAKLKINKRPDSLKLELLTIPENTYVNQFDNRVVNVGFRNISYTIKEGIFKTRSRVILDSINGDFSGGELTAIMGPSGAGKTMLLNILAGYTSKGVLGEKLVNDKPRNELAFQRKSCYIMQDDDLQPLLTVSESMTIAASLKMSSKYTRKEKKNRIKEILESMGLYKHGKTRISALSGGEKKRLSIALELLKNPDVMFFDEPTSGLDSVSSKQCVLLLKQMAISGKTVICTIHQPAAPIFEIFDHLYVISDTKCLYQGSVKGLLPYLEEVDLRCPTYHNPADFLLEVASGEYGDYATILSEKSENGLNMEYRKQQRNSLQLESLEHIGRMMTSGKMTPVHAPPIYFSKSPICCDKDIDISYLHSYKGSYPASFFTQLSVLIRRTFLVITRNKTLTVSRFLTHIVIGLFIGILYFGIGIDASNMLNNFNYIFFSQMFLMMTAFNSVLTTFPSELPILTREHFNKWYSLKSYYLAISIADIPIQMAASTCYALLTYFMTQQPIEGFRVGQFLFICLLIAAVSQSFGLLISATMSINNGVIFGPFCFLPFTIFSGFFVQLTAAHPALQWIFHISFLKYGFEGLVLSIFGYERGKLPCDADYCHHVYPKHFLKDMDMENSTYSLAVIFLISLFIALRIAAFIALHLKVKSHRQSR
ncbi:ATP-binding cassette subfamily G member 4-like [Diabrotica undecimpunctata]|uniref:ATP-binding cassette subfamily G member 4-like n=1 Tax=Diabrotica undecimpunctata TaxID=50387 RepID=UPI003B63F08F